MDEQKYDHATSEIAELGHKLIALGSAMKDPDTSLSELASLAHDAGLRIAFDFDVAG